ICKDIAQTITPTWWLGIPAEFGSYTTGKLKADEWHAAITLHLPITLTRIWGSAGHSEKKRHLLMNTMFLISAIILAT
ncbi:hypothetical protein K439DRAFT_1253636, partial [Ramaria rubella]